MDAKVITISLRTFTIKTNQSVSGLLAWRLSLLMKSQEYSYEMARTDSLNQTTVFDILDKEGWPSHLSDKANRAIWLVIDHSDASNRIKYLDLVKVKAEEGVLSNQTMRF